jgi:hypothetical protein
LSTKLEKLLNILSDNVWHNADQIASMLEVPQDKLQQIITFLAQSDIVQHNQATNQIKINQSWKTLLTDQKETQSGTTALGTIIIPPQQTLVIQCTRITNLTDASLELEICMNNRIREIVINKVK